MMKTPTFPTLPAALGVLLLAAQAAGASPKVIHITPGGDVEVIYPGGEQPSVDTRPTAEVQGEGLPVIVRGPGRSTGATSRSVVVVQRFFTPPYLAAPIAPTIRRPVVHRPVVVRPRVINPHRYSHQDRSSATVIFNGGRGHYDDVDINVAVDHD